MKVAKERPGMAEELWYVTPGRAELREQALGPLLQGEVRVRSLFGAISRGTERLIFEGRVPESEHRRMRAPRMAGDFPFPVKYGYAVVGRIVEGPGEGRVVFALHPHQSEFCVPEGEVVAVPDAVPPVRAVLAANMETALNAVWDANPGPADRIAIVGGGTVGLLVARLCARMPGTRVSVVDIAAGRADLVRSLGAAFAMPQDAPDNCDVVFHASATAAGLKTALRLAGVEATVTELSWYGDGEVSVPLGGAFHSGRLRLVASQVGMVSPTHRARWSHRDRLAAALTLLDDPALDGLLAQPVPFADLPQRLDHIFRAGDGPVCPVIGYATALED